MLFAIIVLTAILSHIIPAGAFEREIVDGRPRVIPNSYKTIEQTPLSFLDTFLAIPGGFSSAIAIIFVVLSSGIMFGVLEKSGMIENAVGTFIKKLGLERRYLVVVIMTYVFGMLGVFVGYENNIALIPIAAITSLALGGDLMLAAAISVGGVTVGFGLSPFNPYTVGTGHTIAEMPMFSGWLIRSILCFSALTFLAYCNIRYFKKIIKTPEKSLSLGIDTSGFQLSKPIQEYRMTINNWLILLIFVGGMAFMLFGVFTYKWYINEISATFIMISIAAGIASRMSGRTISETALKAVSVVAPGAFMVGFATSIKVAMEMGSISDTIAFYLAEGLSGLPVYASAVAMSGAQSVINFFIPSGSGQALATLPIMIPVGDVLGLTRQTTILAYQIGDGVTNLLNPTLGGLIAMLAMCRIPFDRWLRFIIPVVGVILAIAWTVLLVTVLINWGPA
ncbi:C4-dicarboxylate ABC transporter [Roseivirga misakiensis]|uniref:C4-dicarboxylate ABC transporter n=2 Tax=Roseivirga misakiensis TaxID=1563681 RepID=A0A1E5T2M8_9BACT|nr:C4-dicarboxylate ABC transporter [Roseivirga misakiensis]